MYIVADRNGNLQTEASLLDQVLDKMYRHAAGRMLLKPLVVPAVSKFCGKCLDSGISRIWIRGFIRRHSIDLAEYEETCYACFNDFFKRKICPNRRVVCMYPQAFTSPCDGRLCVYKIDDSCKFSVKGTAYTVQSLLRNAKLAGRFTGGYVRVFRLCVEDYHRYIYTDQARVSKFVHIPGVFHTVKPAAYQNIPVYKENTREYCLLRTAHFGTILQMEVGALLVGKIENHPHTESVCRGQEKGNFAYGGSTIILLSQKGKVCPAGDILRHSAAGIETRVRLGEQVGKVFGKF